jgi:uncharacterized membrane protein YraQ (UPF0718 family)
LADWIVVDAMNLPMTENLAQSLHFFIEDTTKIFFLLVVMIYVIAAIRASLNIERVRDHLKKRSKLGGYILGALFGAVTPFCSCSSIPLFLGFTTARIPIGITMSFLITSPMINEVAIIILGSLLGWKFTLAYIGVGMSIGICGGFVLDSLQAEKYLKPFLLKNINTTNTEDQIIQPMEKPKKLSIRERHQYARAELEDILGRVWKWVFIGVGAGAVLHGYVPESWVTSTLGDGQWWSVPIAVFLGIPLYSNATGMIPVMESLLFKGLPVGTTLAFSMSTIAASFPEFILLKQVMEWKLLAILFIILLISFTIVGWFFNIFWAV